MEDRRSNKSRLEEKGGSRDHERRERSYSFKREERSYSFKREERSCSPKRGERSQDHERRERSLSPLRRTNSAWFLYENTGTEVPQIQQVEQKEQKDDTLIYSDINWKQREVKKFIESIKPSIYTSEDFHKRYTIGKSTKSKNGFFGVTVNVKDSNTVCYIGRVNPNDGILEMSIGDRKNKDQKIDYQGTKALYASNICQYLFDDIAGDKPINKVIIRAITNDSTMKAIDEIPDLNVKNIFIDIDDVYCDIALSEIGKVVFRLIKQRNSKSNISSIEVNKEDGSRKVTFSVSHE